MKVTGTRALARLAAVGVLMYVAVDVALAVLRPDLSLIHNPESDYGVGPFSWLMDLNFLLRGALSLCLVGAWARSVPRRGLVRVGIPLLTVWAGASALLAFFPDDPLGTPATPSGGVHLLLALIAFLCLAAGLVLLSLEASHSAVLRPVRLQMAVLAVVAILALLALGRAGFHPHSAGGLYERIFLGCGLLWTLIVSVRLGWAGLGWAGAATAGQPASA